MNSGGYYVKKIIATIMTAVILILGSVVVSVSAAEPVTVNWDPNATTIGGNPTLTNNNLTVNMSHTTKNNNYSTATETSVGSRQVGDIIGIVYNIYVRVRN